MTNRIRRARSADAVAIAELLGQLGYPQPSDGVRPRLDYWLRDETSTVFVWDVDGRVLGVAAVHVMPYFEKPGFFGRVMVLVVSEDVRGTGVGRALLAAAEDFTRERGGVAVELTSNRRREAAHAFYRRRGYKDSCESSGRFLRELV